MKPESDGSRLRMRRKLDPQFRVLTLHELERQVRVKAVHARVLLRGAAAAEEDILVPGEARQLVKLGAILAESLFEEREVRVAERTPRGLAGRGKVRDHIVLGRVQWMFLTPHSRVLPEAARQRI